MKTQKFRLSRIVMNFLLLVYAVFAIFPLIWMLLISFKSDTEVFTTTPRCCWSPTMCST